MQGSNAAKLILRKEKKKKGKALIGDYSDYFQYFFPIIRQIKGLFSSF